MLKVTAPVPEAKAVYLNVYFFQVLLVVKLEADL
jgi:hypothetical protein